jgi:hypothetical protein
MSLSQMNNSLNKLKAAKRSLQQVIREFHERFALGSRAYFDRGDMVFVGCEIIATDHELACVKPDHSDVGIWLKTINGHVYVPWALLFTPDAKAEMDSVRKPAK